MAFIYLLVVVILLLLYIFVKWINKKHEYFKIRGQLHLKPYFLIGSTAGLSFGRYTVQEGIKFLYNKFPNEKIYGFFDFIWPAYFIRDPELMKQITIKDFDYFEDHQQFVDSGSNDLFAHSLFQLKGKVWRDRRATLTPAFTGSKMRLMFKLVTECVQDMTKYLIEKSDHDERIQFEMKDFCSRMTNDIIASCAFGVKVNSLENPENEFLITGRKAIDFPILRTFLVFIFPKLMKKLKINLIPDDVSNYFRSIIRDTINARIQGNIYRPDLINILMQASQGNDINQEANDYQTIDQSMKNAWTEDELMGQSFLFFFAGFETSSTMLSFLSYELAVNPNIQERLYEEIKATEECLNGAPVDYDTLQKMKYLDQVTSETLRKWSPSTTTDRICVKDYTYDDGQTKFHIEKGTNIYIPLYGFHQDPKYFSDPDRFNPERFSDENKATIISGTYIPFSIGPRNCIGSRFALMQIKAIVYHLILNFKLEPNAATQIPIRLKRHPFQLLTEKGINLDFKRR